MFKIYTLVNEVFYFKDIQCTLASINSAAGKLFEKGKTSYERGEGAFKHLFFCSKIISQYYFIDYV